jgi:hypothetical protein
MGPAFAAGTYITQPRGDTTVNIWAAIVCEVRWLNPLEHEDRLIATARIKSIGKSSITYQFQTKNVRTGKLLVTGNVTRLMRKHKGTRPYATLSWKPQKAKNQMVTFLYTKNKELPNKPELTWISRPKSVALGKTVHVDIEVRNKYSSKKPFQVELLLPTGHGLGWEWLSENTFQLNGLETRIVSGRLSAQRPHEVNLGQPWLIRVKLRQEDVVLREISAKIRVPDPQPSKIFCVITEDCETFDGGPKTGAYGAIKELGNQNNFMDPEDYRVQMIHKPEALNAIADRHGARLTHFWTATQRFAAAWAAQQSSTGVWEQICEELDNSIKQGSMRHEYAPHIHFDFEPESKLPPQPRLIYDDTTDGLLPNEYYDPKDNPCHHYHGWDGGSKGIEYVRRGGSFLELDSKIGSLRKTIHYLARCSFGGKPTFTTRTGACDFGVTADNLRISSLALHANGLLADADAPIFGRKTSCPRNRQIYFCKSDNPDLEIEHLKDASIVQLRRPDLYINSSSLEKLNHWFDKRFAACSGPGVHVIVETTHAMFMRGEPDPFRDTKGGDFEKFDFHLEYIKNQYPGVKIVTASEAVLEFLDYYSPELKAVAIEPKYSSPDRTTWIFPIRILGKGIPLSETQFAQLSVQVPATFNADEIDQVIVLEYGKPIAHGEVNRERLSEVCFTARGREGYDLKVCTKTPIICGHLTKESMHDFWIEAKSRFQEYPEEDEHEVFRWEWPRLLSASTLEEEKISEGDHWEWYFPNYLLRFLGNPVAGWVEPLGRRMHPFGGIAFGSALYVTEHLLKSFCPIIPLSAKVRWFHLINENAGLYLKVQLSEKRNNTLCFDYQIYQRSLLHTEVRIKVSKGTDEIPKNR